MCDLKVSWCSYFSDWWNFCLPSFFMFSGDIDVVQHSLMHQHQIVKS